MVLLAAAAAIVATPAPPSSRAPAPVVAVATATVRVLSGVRLKLDAPRNPGAPLAHDCIVTADGRPHQARLIEFE
jgi:hypothetical protein